MDDVTALQIFRRVTICVSPVAGVVCAAVLFTSALAASMAAAPGPDDAFVVARAAHRYQAVYRRPAAVPYPADNAFTPARERLGRTLFFDPRLSGSGSISCASCHNPGFAWGDGLPRAIGTGMRQLDRRTPTILDVAWAQALFWDGRADSLEEQALGPISAESEMDLALPVLVERLTNTSGYRELFARAYPGEPISPETVSKAIATFERGVVSEPAPFDRWIEGDAAAIPLAAQRGFVLFNEKARCSVCHSGWRFSDDGFYDIGVASNDIGRGKVTPKIELSRFAFKTPPLRNVALRAPYLHDGSAPTLEAVVDLYDRGGDSKRPSLSPEIRPLSLTAGEKQDLIAFLRTLTSRETDARVPPLPR
jgi:cytochrome c peroxidase